MRYSVKMGKYSFYKVKVWAQRECVFIQLKRYCNAASVSQLCWDKLASAFWRSKPIAFSLLNASVYWGFGVPGALAYSWAQYNAVASQTLRLLLNWAATTASWKFSWIKNRVRLFFHVNHFSLPWFFTYET